jgi:uncharacterized OB-fold protein
MPDAAGPSQRPTPSPDEASRTFFDAAAQGKFLIKHCPACDRYLAPALDACDLCHSEAIEWREASGRATLYSFVVVHQAPHPGFADAVPYTVIVVELEEGPRINGSYRGSANLIVGMPLAVAFEPAGDVTVPVWR